MRRVWMAAIMLCLLLALPANAQDGLDLPTELYVLTNAGQVQQYGLGAAGVRVVTPEDEYIIDFAVAPDSNWIAYRSEGGLTLYNIYAQVSADLEGDRAGLPPFRGRGETMTWSPQGDALVYTTDYGARVYFNGNNSFLDLPQGAFEQVIWSPSGEFLAAGAENDIWWFYRREANTLTLTGALPSSQGVAWASGAEVVFAPADGGVFGLNLGAANQQSQLLDSSAVYTLPMMLADGRVGVFKQESAESGAGTLVAINLQTLESEALGQSAVELNGLRWAPGGQLLIALRGGVLALVGPANGAGFALPVADAVAYSWGPPLLERVGGAALPTAITFVTGDANDVQQVWRLPEDGSSPLPITQAERDVTAYAVSADGAALVYATGDTLWAQRDNAAAQLEQFAGREIRAIAFHPDGRTIAFAVVNTAENPEGGLYLRDISSGTATPLLRNGPAGEAAFQPPFYDPVQFAPNVNALLVSVDDGSTTSLGILDLNTTGSGLIRLGDFDTGIWLRDGRVLAFGDGVRSDAPSAQQILTVINPADLTRREVGRIAAPERILTVREVANGLVRLALGSTEAGPRALSIVDVDITAGTLTPPLLGGFMVNPMLSIDGGWLAGQTHADGPLTLRELSSRQQVVLAEPPRVTVVRW
ncbi:MAG: PD40 domain-containing protein [Anaerolineae bacterium]|nr:PD40 domain-containing protein [Anaerolineae bacterium]